MNRRDAVIQLAVASGAWISLPFWMVACRMSDTDRHLSGFSPHEQQTLAAIVDAIIPAGPHHEPGALAVGVDKYLQKLIDDCFEPAARDGVKRQLQAVQPAPDIAASLQRFSVSADKDQKEFFDLMKRETIRGFNTSQQVMTDYLHYKIAPGHYYGNVPVKSQA
ncbi:MAG TPA: gluconate 2-dehydrogenase subunit 3 family protein [Puia sp.]|nr:gluconate 2-dehydrogenase subunit 3 family protein [Puia sp.]